MAEKSEKKEGVTIKVPRVSPWAISTLILLVILAIFLAYPGITGRVVSTDGTVSALSAEEAANKAINWISSYYKSVGADVEVSLVNASETENGVYQFTIKLSSAQGDFEQTHYVTRDGKLLFASAIETEEIIPESPEQPTPETPEVPKSDKPEVHAFVMSYCPYGLQFMKAYIPVIELLGDKADLELNFVHYIMHGEKEMTENTRIYCIQKEENDKFTDYLRCFVENDDPEGCMEQTEIDTNKIDTCMQDTDEEFEITKTFEESEDPYPPYDVDAELAGQYGISGSPTFVINGKIISVTRSANAIKEAVCAAFNTPPEECETELSTTAEQPGIGPIAAGGSASSSGQC